jgi:hypothetical protein
MTSDSSVSSNKCTFNKLLAIAKNEKNIEEKCLVLSLASFYATYNYIGSMYSLELEDYLISISNNLPSDNPCIKRKKGCLHVVTEFYNHGGHSRVIERWLEFDKGFDDALVVINPKRSSSVKLKSKCNVYSIIQNNFHDKAVALRNIALKYEKVVLHTHMYDVVPLIAFGKKLPETTIYYYNHADHLFWIGRNISDITLNISTEAATISERYRGNCTTVNFNNFLPVPLLLDESLDNISCNKIKFKESLGVAENKRVILTVGSVTRYVTTEYSIIDVFNELNENLSDFIFLVVGAKKDDLFWREVIVNDNFLVIDKVSKEYFDKLVSIADLYIESFPFSSSTSSIEIIMKNIPSIFVTDDFPQFDSYIDFSIDRKKLSSYVIRLLSSDTAYKKRIEIQNKMKTNIVNQHGKDGWLAQKRRIFSNKSTPVKSILNSQKIVNYEKTLIDFLSNSHPNTKLNYVVFFKLNLINKIKVTKVLGFINILKKPYIRFSSILKNYSL